MQTIRLQVSDRMYEKLLHSLSRIEGDDIQIIRNEDEFQNHVAEASEDYMKLKSGASKIIDFEDFEEAVLKSL